VTLASLTHKDVTTMLGPLDDVTVAKVIATGASAEELAQAQAWLGNDEVLVNAGKPLPAGCVGELVEIVAALSSRKRRSRISRSRPKADAKTRG
jgi:hypothetical protein